MFNLLSTTVQSTQVFQRCKKTPCHPLLIICPFSSGAACFWRRHSSQHDVETSSQLHVPAAKEKIQFTFSIRSLLLIVLSLCYISSWRNSLLWSTVRGFWDRNQSPAVRSVLVVQSYNRSLPSCRLTRNHWWRFQCLDGNCGSSLGPRLVWWSCPHQTPAYQIWEKHNGGEKRLSHMVAFRLAPTRVLLMCIRGSILKKKRETYWTTLCLSPFLIWFLLIDGFHSCVLRWDVTKLSTFWRRFW